MDVTEKYVCRLCGKGFHSNLTLEQHVKKTHDQNHYMEILERVLLHQPHVIPDNNVAEASKNALETKVAPYFELHPKNIARGEARREIRRQIAEQAAYLAETGQVL